MSNLATLKPGQSATITGMRFERAFTFRLAAMGFRIGKRVQVIRGARFAGPLHVRIGSTDIMLRRHEARHIDIASPTE
jgi:Fe2+ transport system protein FeoA